jgi:signal transduction histidine kinase
LKDGKVHTTEVTEEETLGGCFEITTTPIKDSEGIVYGSVHVGRDVTEAKRTEIQLLELNKKLELLSSITRHDILNQLMVLSGNIEILKASESREEKDRRIAKMQHAVDVIRRQIEFAKDYERLGKSDPAWQDIEAIIRSVVSRKDMGRIMINCESLGLEVLADPMLEKVFYNLLDNTLRHGGKASTIHVVCEARPEGVTIIYEDDGVGILPDEKERIFQKGFGKNTGLGLFLSREILAITSITIIENGTRGVGSRFELFVPAAKARWK